MSYVMAAGLQAALHAALTADGAVAALVGAAIHDQIPPGAPPDLYVLIGAEAVRGRSSQTSTGAEHDVTITLVSRRPGFAGLKALAGTVCDALAGPLPALQRGRIVCLNFHRARAERTGSDSSRRIDLIFRARLEDE